MVESQTLDRKVTGSNLTMGMMLCIRKAKQTKIILNTTDLKEMMLECSDLKAPQKAKLFHKPALKELPPTHNQSQVPVHNDSQTARKWNQTWNQSEELSELFIQEGRKCVMPADLQILLNANLIRQCHSFFYTICIFSLSQKFLLSELLVTS